MEGREQHQPEIAQLNPKLEPSKESFLPLKKSQQSVTGT